MRRTGGCLFHLEMYFPSSRADFRGVSLAANWTADRKECRPPTRPSIPRDFRMSAQGKPRRVRVIGAVTSELNIIFSDECRPLNLAGRVCARVRACHRSYYRGHLVPDRLYTSLLPAANVRAGQPFDPFRLPPDKLERASRTKSVSAARYKTGLRTVRRSAPRSLFRSRKILPNFSISRPPIGLASPLEKRTRDRSESFEIRNLTSTCAYIHTHVYIYNIQTDERFEILRGVRTNSRFLSPSIGDTFSLTFSLDTYGPRGIRFAGDDREPGCFPRSTRWRKSREGSIHFGKWRASGRDRSKEERRRRKRASLPPPPAGSKHR